MEMVPIFTTLFVFGAAVAIVALALRQSARKLEHQEVMKALEMGQDIPSIEVKKKHSLITDLRWGIIFLTVGIGMLLWLLTLEFTDEVSWHPHFSIAYVPIFVGIGFLVMAFMLKKVIKNGNGNNNG